MKNCALLVVLCLLALPACEPTTLQDNTREIHKTERQDGTMAPMRALDEAVQTEGMTHENAIFKQLQMLLIKNGGDINKLSSEMSGPLNATKLQKLGITEAELKGQYYKASDYVLSFNGKQVTITASYPGTRGYTSNPFTLR